MGNMHRQRKTSACSYSIHRGWRSKWLKCYMSVKIHSKNEVLDSSEPVLVDFSAVWCQPCKMLDPIVKQLAGEWDGKVKVVKIDADENPNLVMQFGVMGIPTLLFFKGGEIKERITGFCRKTNWSQGSPLISTDSILLAKSTKDFRRVLSCLIISHEQVQFGKIHPGGKSMLRGATETIRFFRKTNTSVSSGSSSNSRLHDNSC